MSYTYSYIETKTEEILLQNDLFEAGFDVEKLTKKLGVEVVPEKLDDDVSGLFVRIHNRPVISYNKNNSIPTRKRFTIAHELGHYILHSDKPLFIDKKPKVMFRNSASSSGEELQEREANHFAAALLMPTKLIREEIINIVDEDINPIEYLAKKFKVSEQAMTFRLANLGYDVGLY